MKKQRVKAYKPADKAFFKRTANKTNVKNLSNKLMMRGGFHF